MDIIAFGGGCHWCTEAVFQSLKGIENVEQGFVASNGENNTFSEAVIVHFYPELISLSVLIEIHLNTHKSTSNHSMREKYRSAIYTFDDNQKKEASLILNQFQNEFRNQIITKVLAFKNFKPSTEQFQNYYLKNPKKPFCERFINPKLELLQKQFSEELKTKELEHKYN